MKKAEKAPASLFFLGGRGLSKRFYENTIIGLQKHFYRENYGFLRKKLKKIVSGGVVIWGRMYFL
ncbi:MAG: hypothetical protein ACYTBV_15400 [Planctomycetota bacterium]